MSGWIKLHRKFSSWEWFSSPNHTVVFLDLLLNANHKDKKYRGVDVKAGQLTTSLSAIASRTGLTIGKVRTVLKDLKATHEITHEGKRHYSIISIVKWCDYQVDNTPDNIDITSTQHRHNIDITTNKNVKNVNNVKNVKNKGAQKTKGAIVEFSESEDIRNYLESVTQETQKKWIETYPDKSWLIQEINKAIIWEMSATTKKKNKGQFLSGWFGRGWKNKNAKTGYPTKAQQVQESQDSMLALREQFLNM